MKMSLLISYHIVHSIAKMINGPEFPCSSNYSCSHLFYLKKTYCMKNGLKENEHQNDEYPLPFVWSNFQEMGLKK